MVVGWLRREHHAWAWERHGPGTITIAIRGLGLRRRRVDIELASLLGMSVLVGMVMGR
jgi:hypothetical protein